MDGLAEKLDIFLPFGFCMRLYIPRLYIPRQAPRTCYVACFVCEALCFSEYTVSGIVILVRVHLVRSLLERYWLLAIM